MKPMIKNRPTKKVLAPYLIWRVDREVEHERMLPMPSSHYASDNTRQGIMDVTMGVLMLVLWLISESVLADTEVKESKGKAAATYSSLWLKIQENAEKENQNSQMNRYAATTLSTDVSMKVSGPILRARVRQTFSNPSQFWAEGIYTFPLPVQAAVDRLRMIVGERVIEGQIHEKQAAKSIYKQARDEGKRTSLLSHHRSNVFTTAVANIGPGEHITVEFEYQQVLDFKEDRYLLRFPMVNTPKYTPARTRIDPNFVAPVSLSRTAEEPPGNPVTISLDIKSGFPLASVISSSHTVKTEQLSETHYKILLAGEAKLSNRDFLLTWRLKLSSEPMVSVLQENVGGESYGLLMLMPPQGDAKITLPRELVFVLDVSGSMQGESIEQARSAVLKAISSLDSEDRFNVIFFNTNAWKLFPNSQFAEADKLNAARQKILGQLANGGTDMRPALRMALRENEDVERLRQVIFITDGAVSNEAELFSEINQHLGDSRLFTVGIGSAPNSYFMRKAARAGRGMFTYVSQPSEVGHKINRLLRQLAAPALTDIEFDLHGAPVSVLPNPLPDLYLGEPVYVAFKLKSDAYSKSNSIPDFASLSGNLGGVASQVSVSLQGTEKHEGVAVEWARRKINALLEKHKEQGKAQKQDIQSEIVALALAHHQVSKFTSLVAVDVSPVRAGGLLHTTRIPTNRPKGWVGAAASAVPGIRLAQTATDAQYRLWLGLVCLLSALCLLLGLQRRAAWLRNSSHC